MLLWLLYMLKIWKQAFAPHLQCLCVVQVVKHSILHVQYGFCQVSKRTLCVLDNAAVSLWEFKHHKDSPQHTGWAEHPTGAALVTSAAVNQHCFWMQRIWSPPRYAGHQTSPIEAPALFPGAWSSPGAGQVCLSQDQCWLKAFVD